MKIRPLIFLSALSFMLLPLAERHSGATQQDTAARRVIVISLG